MNTDVKEFIPLNPHTIAKLIEHRQVVDADTQGRKRRRLARWPFPGQLQLWVRDSAGQEDQLFGTCHNINQHGIGVICERYIETGLRVPIAIHEPEATYHGEGVVRHCTASGKEYFVGIEFIETGA